MYFFVVEILKSKFYLDFTEVISSGQKSSLALAWPGTRIHISPVSISVRPDT